jgi:branched-chain amino acid aminotransferase
VFCIAGKLTLFPPRPDGISLASVSVRRPDPDMLDPRVKSLNYINNIMAKMEAKQRGADEALVLNRRGTIAEASGANVFCVKDQTLYTPPTADGALAGITRRRVLQLAGELGIPTREQSLVKMDLLEASEVFLTGTGAGIVAVGTLDGVGLGRDRTISSALVAETPKHVRKHGTPVLPAAAHLASLASSA